MASNISPHRFPNIELAVEAGALHMIDLEFAQMLLEDVSELDESAAAFVCHLTKSAREGHLCVNVSDSGITPSPYEIWLRDCSEDVIEKLYHLMDLVSTGAEKLPESIFVKVDTFSTVYPEQPICLFENSFYLQKYWVFETHFLHYLLPLLSQSPAHSVDADVLEGMLTDIPLNTLQKKALRQVFQNRLSIISGGPGTGKTHTAGVIVDLFSKLFKEKDFRIAITAPTGKAAAKLRSSLGCSSDHAIESATLHALLNLSPDSTYTFPPRATLPYDLLIVDECSMIDVKLMASLLPAIKEGARLMFLGDPDQLPPVEAGSLFSDLIKSLDSLHIVHLEECLRAELEELVAFGKAINSGRVDHFPACVDRIKPGAESVRLQESELLRELVSYLPSRFTYEHSQEIFDRFRVLSPLRNGRFGVNQLNHQLLQIAFQKTDEQQEYVVPIMITKNHPKRELFNGETGLLVRKKGETPYSLNKEDYAVFGDRKIPALLLPAFEYAFCLSVHKSQGSEFEHVFLVLPKGSEWFGREMVYTAVTRAKKKLTIWGDDTVIHEALKNHCHRASGLSERISHHSQPNILA